MIFLSNLNLENCHYYTTNGHVWPSLQWTSGCAPCAILVLFLVQATAISSRNKSPPARTQVHTLQNTLFQIHRKIQSALIISKKFYYKNKWRSIIGHHIMRKNIHLCNIMRNLRNGDETANIRLIPSYYFYNYLNLEMNSYMPPFFGRNCCIFSTIL